MARPPIKDKNVNSGLLGLGPLPGQSPVGSFNVDQIENLLQTKGFVAYHLRSCPSPDRNTIAGSVNPNTNAAHRGHIYYEARPLRVIPQRFSLDDRLNVQGIWGVGTAIMNITGKYIDEAPEDKKPVYVRQHDLIVIPSETIQTDQLFEYNPTGPQRLHHRVLSVDILMDRKNIYEQDVDFIVKDGEIVWMPTGKKPDYSPNSKTVLSCVYYTMPIYIVQQMPHSLRIIPSNEIGHGALPRNAVYAPQQIIVRQSTIVDEAMKENGIYSLLDWKALPNLPEWRDSDNTTGGSL